MLENELSILLVSLVLLLSLSLILGHLVTLCGVPRVVGEIFAGILVGPTIFGHFYSSYSAAIFSGFHGQNEILSAFYWLGLMLLMFTAGFKLSPKLEKNEYKTATLLVIGGLFFPFLFGLFASNFLPNNIGSSSIAFALILGSAAAVTSIPVLTRIFIDLNLITGHFAQTILLAAAVQDTIIWCIVAIALSLNNTTANQAEFFDIDLVAKTIGGILIYGFVAIIIFPRISALIGRLILKRSPDTSLIGYTLLSCLFLVSLASLLSVNIIFAALIAGIVIGKLPDSRFNFVKASIQNIAIWFFVPIYFALVGMKMNLIGNFDLNLVTGFLLGSSAIKIFSVVLVLRLINIKWRLAIDYGLTMNCRGGPGIALASVAYSARIIDDELFITFIFASVVTSILTGIWLKYRIDQSNRFGFE